jgi:hypothetical protein
VPHPDSESPTNARKRRVIFIIMIFSKTRSRVELQGVSDGRAILVHHFPEILTPKSSSSSPPLS